MNYRILALSIFVLSFLFSCGEDKTSNPTNNQPVNYESVTIGAQIWMKKNLDVICYRNGDTIPQVTNVSQWDKLTTGAWCYYNNDPANGAIYGKLYNWYAVNDPRGLAPAGWHIPTITEWNTLITSLGGWETAGGKLKEAGTSHWYDPNSGATNSSGFTALPGGGISAASFNYLKDKGFWWTSSKESSSDANGYYMYYYYTSAIPSSYSLTDGLSVRCVKD
ncbi:MAG: hypothetical protein QG635_812 [Bacteroidota bacterium]|nr:hypothetical protein [Bacteroidota bacterium]